MSTTTVTKSLVEITPRGPSIAGTRITVYSIMDSIKANWSKAEILAHLPRVTLEQLEAVYEYIEEHRDEVEAEYAQILRDEAEARAESERMLRERGLYTLDLPLEERRQRLLKKLEARKQVTPGQDEDHAAA